MFDTITVGLISEAPALSGLDLANLPRELTKAYATIIASRVRLGNLAHAELLSEDVEGEIFRMQKLAFAYEAFVTAHPLRENRAAAAFVAASAQHICLIANKIKTDEIISSSLGLKAIPPEVSAALLFLIAEASADAAEMAKAINVASDNPVEKDLLNAIISLATGKLTSILSIPLARPSLQSASQSQNALDALLYIILRGVRALAAHILNVDSADDVGLSDDNPTDYFERARDLCIEPLDIQQDVPVDVLYNIFSGPLHLATLLSCVSKDLIHSAMAHLPAPPNVNVMRWQTLVMEMAKRRPYLWKNHREAIETGYLEHGTSAVISFPTGAGKSTLAELKIAVALLRGRKIIFLAPTLALVDQTATALRKTFPTAEVQSERSEEALFAEILPTISVMTPEKCLAAIGDNKVIFEDVGLLVFDECHLLHPRDFGQSRRSIDAMLCVLNFVTIAQDADLLLLSAMMKNADDIAGWLEELTRRRCLSLTLTWKPTRQVRGCVVYDAEQITALQSRLHMVRREVDNKNPPVHLQRELVAQPFGFFCLRQTWQSTDITDYALMPLLEDAVQLGTGTGRTGNWYLTPNGNNVAATLAAATSMQGLKTLIFTQTIVSCNAAVKTVNSLLGSKSILLSEAEQILYRNIIEEVGDESHTFMNVTTEGILISASACHHGLLLPQERHLHESLFKREDGIDVLVATSTLAQGMNLPSEVVIISGDSRFDSNDNKMTQLEAHELLNAAGRAGRAGENANGFVLVVPSKVVHFDSNENRIHHHWGDLKVIFSQSDQCLDIEDPLQVILDQIHLATEEPTDIAKYFISRLPIDAFEGQTRSDDAAKLLLHRSLGAYHARKRNDQNWIDSRVQSALSLRLSLPEAPEVFGWMDHLAGSVGVSVSVIRQLKSAILSTVGTIENDIVSWRRCLFNWLRSQPDLIVSLMRPGSLEAFLGKKYTDLLDNNERGSYALPLLEQLLSDWMVGNPLSMLETTFGMPVRKLGKCDHAREFVIRIVPDLAYIARFVLQVFNGVRNEIAVGQETPFSFNSLAACIREGFDSLEKLILRQIRGRKLSRVNIHNEFLQLNAYISPTVIGEEYDDVVNRIKNAIALYDALG